MNRHWLNINTDRPNCYSVCSLYFVTKTDTFKSLKLLLWAVICFILSFSVVPALLPLLGCPGRQKASSLSDFSQTLPIFHRWPSSTSKRIDPLETQNPSSAFYYNFWQECAFQIQFEAVKNVVIQRVIQSDTESDTEWYANTPRKGFAAKRISEQRMK